MDTSSISNLLHIAASRIARRVRTTDVEEGMSPARISLLSILVREGALTLGELARIEKVRAPTMTNIIKSLEKDAYIVRRAHKLDGRVVNVQVTAKGKRRYLRSLRRRETMMDDLLEDLSHKELKAVEKAALILESHLTKLNHSEKH